MLRLNSLRRYSSSRFSIFIRSLDEQSNYLVSLHLEKLSYLAGLKEELRVVGVITVPKPLVGFDWMVAIGKS